MLHFPNLAVSTFTDDRGKVEIASAYFIFLFDGVVWDFCEGDVQKLFFLWVVDFYDVGQRFFHFLFH